MSICGVTSASDGFVSVTYTLGVTPESCLTGCPPVDVPFFYVTSLAPAPVPALSGEGMWLPRAADGGRGADRAHRAAPGVEHRAAVSLSSRRRRRRLGGIGNRLDAQVTFPTPQFWSERHRWSRNGSYSLSRTVQGLSVAWHSARHLVSELARYSEAAQHNQACHDEACLRGGPLGARHVVRRG